MIYCVEDDMSSRELMVYTLKTAGFEVCGFDNAASFWQAVKLSKPELVLLDIMLPDEDGISILKKLRRTPDTSDIPVIMASARGTEYDKVMGLDLGADDYLAKPFGMMELISRVKAVLRRSGGSVGETDAILRAGDIELDTDAHTVKVYGKPVELTYKEYELLKLFISKPGRVYTREQILKIIWEIDYEGETRTVDVHIGTLRAKLKDQGRLIQTVRGVGYRMEIPKQAASPGNINKAEEN